MTRTKFVIAKAKVEIRQIISVQYDMDDIQSEVQKSNKIIDIVIVLEAPEHSSNEFCCQLVSVIFDRDFQFSPPLYGDNGNDLLIKYKIQDLTFEKVDRVARFIF